MSSVLYEPNAAEWAWAAGFYEGEGSVTFSPGKNPAVRMQISQKDPEPLFRWKYIVQCGQINGPYPRDARPIYYWQMGKRDEIVRLFDGMNPWLSHRRRMRYREIIVSYREALLQKGIIWDIMGVTND